MATANGSTEAAVRAIKGREIRAVCCANRDKHRVCHLTLLPRRSATSLSRYRKGADGFAAESPHASPARPSTPFRRLWRANRSAVFCVLIGQLLARLTHFHECLKTISMWLGIGTDWSNVGGPNYELHYFTDADFLHQDSNPT